MIAKVTLSPEKALAHWRSLVATMPDLLNGPPEDVDIWLGKVVALSGADGSMSEVSIKLHVQNFRSPIGLSFQSGLSGIKDHVYSRLAAAELNSPTEVSGAFIPAKNAHDALSAIGGVLESAQQSVLIIDPYLGGDALKKFIVFARETVPIRLLADAKHVKPTLQPAVDAWTQQFGVVRPIEARLSAARSLHDRLIILDGSHAWILTQSFNAFADRAPATIQKADPESAKLKIEAYEDLWRSSIPL